MMFAAAGASDDSLRNALISSVHSYVFTPTNTTPIGPIYDPTTGASDLVGINRFGFSFVIFIISKAFLPIAQRWEPCSQCWH